MLKALFAKQKENKLNNFSWVHEIKRVQRLLYTSHHGDALLAKLFAQEIHFAETDSVLASTGSYTQVQ